MESFWLNWTLLIGIFGMALASPGPDFIIAVRNSILHSRMVGIFTAIGFALGVCIHITYTLFGIAAIISQSIILFSILKYVGAAYLLYIGAKALFSNGFKQETGQAKDQKIISMTATQALWNGFLVNTLNPKAAMFFLAIFSQFIGPETSLTTQVIYGSTCIIMTGIWFSIVAIILTNPKIKSAFLRFTKWIDRICGSLLIALGIKLALSRAL